ncbi:GPC5 family protein [Megaselia abdita]
MGSINNIRCVFYAFALIYSFNNIRTTNSSNIDHTYGHLSHREQNSCNHVKLEFSLRNIDVGYDINHKGKICGGHCCSNDTETHLKKDVRKNFKTHIEHHTKSLQGVLEKTFELFQNHVLELIFQSRNKSLSVFSMVDPTRQSRKPLHELYSTIIEKIKSNYPNNLENKKETEMLNIEDAVDMFFVNLFPIAYHKAVNYNYQTDGDFHVDYANCLKHIYKDLEPFGSVSNDLSTKLKLNLKAASYFTNSLLESAAVLSDINKIDVNTLSETCQNQLVKMTDCPMCNGLSRTSVRTCHSYCLNIMRGCLAQLGFAELDGSWAKVADAIENLVTNSIQSNNGVLKSIKSIDSDLSNAIMTILNKGSALEEKIKQSCGPTSFVPMEGNIYNIKHQQKIDSASSSSDFLPELLSFLTAISKSKQFYTNIVNSLCSDDNIKNTDIHCWTGDHVGDYSYTMLMPGGAQKYNPEVPMAKDQLQDSVILHELIDRLFKISSKIGATVSFLTLILRMLLI